MEKEIKTYVALALYLSKKGIKEHLRGEGCHGERTIRSNAANAMQKAW